METIKHKIRLELYWDYTLEAVPEWALSYLVNSDPSGLSDEDIKACDEWAERMHAAGYSTHYFDFCCEDEEGNLCTDDEQEPSFTWSPAFGLACNCYTCFFGDYKD